ncbi:MAG: DUF3649 domain-containing protein [Pseudomonas sp.]|uniref:DUF3649 domain-containing protein n=1 Tax=Pseudomonas sp. TaxID=306 RepID=UPI003D14925D
MKSKAAGLPVSYRLAVTSRCLAALLGGYLLAAMASVSLSLLLPLPRGEAVISGMMLSFLFYLGAFIWVFAARNAWMAWFGVLAPSAALAIINGLTWWVGHS